ncbi:lactosylceramide 4-alpha-galactosyltransferase-like [Centruroides sculpturatus]|uniref:lactosylceramide 4-alpha-galactosyltransferase-like n=1 Tax=Centruroides sculpturatus TaxID=218467 RepID=UPI000C6CB1B5|nr:lactosylceramide 4-alpha-galactosyltransferase-like [Centruroides sculpturatus]
MKTLITFLRFFVLIGIAVFIYWRLSIFIGWKRFTSLEATTDVIFLETSGNSLNLRQACAIESAAVHYRRFEINVMILKEFDYAYGLKKRYSNIKLNRIDLNDTFEGTPLEEWFRSKKWSKSKYSVTELSDALRMLLIWKFGGMYLDLDVVILKPVYDINNFIIMQDNAYVNNAIFRFDQWHNFLYRCLLNFHKNYNETVWGSTGPNLFTKTVKDYCKIDSFKRLSAKNCDMDVLPEDTAFPIHYSKWQDYFRPPTSSLMNILKESFAIHVWNNLSKNETIQIGSGSIYEIAMKENCPFIYEKLKKKENNLRIAIS